MTIIHTYLSTAETIRLSQRDTDYFKRKLHMNCLLSELLHRRVNKPLLTELMCLLDRKPIPRHTVQHRHGPVQVYKLTPEEMEKLWT